MITGDLYSRLGVSSVATAEEIKAAYRTVARRFHPDVNTHTGAAEEFRVIAEAYSILGDPARRAAYDSAMAQAQTKALLAIRLTYSRETLPLLADPQVWYVLAEITPGTEVALAEPPLNLCLVVDRSTSMQGARLEQVKASVLQVLDGLREQDTFSVVAFSDKAEVIIPAQRGSHNRVVAKSKIVSLSAGGGTEILQGLMCGLIELHQHLQPQAINHLILLTDGRTYGDEADCLMLASLAATDGISISGLGIGEEWNDRFLDELTGRTGGVTTYIGSPNQLKNFIQERARGLSQVYAERLTLQITPDQRNRLESAFKLSPEPNPIPIKEQPLYLGSLPRQGTVAVLLKFRLPPCEAGEHAVARLSFQADVISMNRQNERTTCDLVVNVTKAPPPHPSPPALVEALSKFSQYKLQERAWQEADNGNVVSAAQRLQTLSTRLLASGQTDLAKVALSEARRLESTQILSEEAKKQLKYGTRALMQPQPSGRKL